MLKILSQKKIVKMWKCTNIADQLAKNEWSTHLIL